MEMTITVEQYNTLQTRIAELEALVNFYQEQFRLTKHHQFGSSSEKSKYDGDVTQLDIFNEAEVIADAMPPEQVSKTIEPASKEKEHQTRQRRRLVNYEKLPKGVPVEVVEHSIPEAEQICSTCGSPLHEIDTEVRREITIIPPQVKIIEHRRKVYGCRECEKDEGGTPVVRTPVDEPVIKGGFASPESIAHIMTEKFVMGSPLYRQEQYWNRKGINLSRQTMSNWIIIATEDWLAPVYDALKAMLITLYVLFADETTLQVLHEKGKTAQSKSYMWLYRTGMDVKNPIVLYEYRPDRKKENPQRFLTGFKGYLHTDGYDGYHSLPNDIVVVGCWAHVRRKFDEGVKSLLPKDREGSHVLRGKRYCDKLFELERDFLTLTPEERYLKRLELSTPVVEEFFAWLNDLKPLPNSFLGKATNYALGQRKYLENFLLDGNLELSNNRAERSIKPFVIDRKNFLFANTARGATASAIMFSIIETAKENGLDPFKYLTFIFTNAPKWDIKNNPDRVKELLPAAAPDSCRIL
jgi:transposase